MKFSTLNERNPWHDVQQHRPWMGWQKNIRLFLSQRTDFIETTAKIFILSAVLWFIIMPWAQPTHIQATNSGHLKLFSHFVFQIGIPFFLLISGFLMMMLSASGRWWAFQMDLMSEYAFDNAEKLAQHYPQFLPILQAWTCLGPLTEREASLIRELHKKDERGLLTPGKADPRMTAFSEFAKRIGVEQEVISTIRARHALNDSLPECEVKTPNKKRL